MGLRAYGSDGARVYPELNLEGARLRLGFAQPGTYELSIPDLRGFEAIPTQYVEVGEARRSLRVRLVRALP